uniref:Uncharacterized protein n=1 Tax=Arundo donax TaxID=35708 RepID=A0A0A8Z804_ARUDO
MSRRCPGPSAVLPLSSSIATAPLPPSSSTVMPSRSSTTTPPLQFFCRSIAPSCPLLRCFCCSNAHSNPCPPGRLLKDRPLLPVSITNWLAEVAGEEERGVTAVLGEVVSCCLKA